MLKLLLFLLFIFKIEFSKFEYFFYFINYYQIDTICTVSLNYSLHCYFSINCIKWWVEQSMRETERVQQTWTKKRDSEDIDVTLTFNRMSSREFEITLILVFILTYLTIQYALQYLLFKVSFQMLHAQILSDLLNCMLVLKSHTDNLVGRFPTNYFKSCCKAMKRMTLHAADKNARSRQLKVLRLNF